jgi:hypothetical protein
MSLILANCWYFGYEHPIWDAVGSITTILDGDNGDDIDGNTRWGCEVNANEFENVHPNGMKNWPSPDCGVAGKVRVGNSFKMSTAQGVGYYIAAEGRVWPHDTLQLSGNPDWWSWGIRVVAVNSYLYVLYHHDTSAGTDTVIAESAAAYGSGLPWVYVTMEYSLDTTDSGETINEGAEFSSSDTTLTVSDGTTFTQYEVIKIESELLQITAISSNDLTVKRGVLGSTAAAHADSTAIYWLTPTCALYATDSGGETNVIAAQSEPAAMVNGHGHYQGGWAPVNYQDSGKGAHTGVWRFCNNIITDDQGANFTGRIAWNDRSVIMARLESDVSGKADWTASGEATLAYNLDDWARDAGCGSANDNITSSTDGHIFLGEAVNVSNVRGVHLICAVSSGGVTTWDFRAHVNDGETETGNLNGVTLSPELTEGIKYLYPLILTPDGNAWTDAKFNALRAGVEKDGATLTRVQRYGVICVGDTGTALEWPAKRSCAAATFTPRVMVY